MLARIRFTKGLQASRQVHLKLLLGLRIGESMAGPGTQIRVAQSMQQMISAGQRTEHTELRGQNPLDIEVWGIADTASALTSLPGNDPGWKAEAISKGWTLLTEVQRSDNGVAPVTVNLISNPPPVRFVMVRMVTVNDNSTNANMTQLTFWAKE